MTAESDIAALSDGGANPIAEIRTALTSVLARGDHEWTTWSPTWDGASSSPAIGNGTLAGRYAQAGVGAASTLFVQVQLVAGSTTTFGSGNWRFDLPGSAVAQESLLTNRFPLGLAVAFDSNTSTVRLGFVRWNVSSNVVEVFMMDSGAAADSSTPMTWATDDELLLNFVVEVG